MTKRERYLLTGVRVCLALVCLIPLAVSYTTVFPFVVGKSLLARSLVEVAFAGWLLLAWRAPEYRPNPSVILLALLAWLGVSTLAALLGVNVARSLWSGYERMHGVVELAHWCGFILVAASVFRTFSAWQALLTAHLAVGAVVSALGLAGYLGLVGWVWVFSEVARAGSTLGSGLYLGAYAAMNAGLGVALLFRPWRDHWRWRGAWIRYLLAAAVVLNLAALWTSAARSGLLGVVAMALVFAGGALLLDRRRAIVGAALATLAVLVVVSAVGLLGGRLGLPPQYDVMSRRLSEAVSGEEGKSAQNRLNTLRIGLEAYRERPLLGWGPENYRSAWGRYITVDEYSGHSVDQAHNKAVDTLVSTGTVGFFIYSLLWLALALTALRLALDREGDERRFALAMAAALAGYLTISLFLFDTPSFMLQFALVVAFFASQEHGAAGLLRTWPSWGRRVAGRLTALARRRYAAPAAAALVAAALVFSLVQWNVKPFLGAQNIALQRTWPETLREARGIYQEFPPLAGHWRTAMVVNTINAMPSLPEDELEEIIAAVGEEIELILADEPNSWYAHYLAAQFYVSASHRQGQYLRLAEHHAGELKRVAPHSPYLQELAGLERALGSTAGTGPDGGGW